MKKNVFFLSFLGLLLIFQIVQAQETGLSLDNAADWKCYDESAKIADGELVLDGRKAMSNATFLPMEWTGDVKLTADFNVEPSPEGVLACGFCIAMADATTFYYVHFDRWNAILCYSNENFTWKELVRKATPGKRNGQWCKGSLSLTDSKLTVTLDGEELYSVENKELAPGGRVGFYANQGIAHVKNIVVTGACEKTDKEFVVPASIFNYVCTDAGAGAYEAFPDVCQLADGRLMCVFYAGYGHVALPNDKLPKGGRIAACYSSDEGKTWTEPQTIIDTPVDDRDPSVVQLKDGRILCNFFTYPVCNTMISESSDGGKTWSEPRVIYPEIPCSSPIRVLSDGTLLLPTYVFDRKNNFHAGSVGLSYDNGKTWSPNIVISNGGMHLDAETDVIELKDGTLYALQRPAMAWSISKDMGKTWSVSQNVGFSGHCPYFLRTKDDAIIVALRLPLTCIRVSRDECKTWSDSIPVDRFIGAYPSMVELEDGSILIVYYEEGANSSIRCKKFKLNADNSVEWLPFE